VEDKAPAGSTGEKTFSWWDVQDENARLPVKEAPSNKLAKFFAPPTEVVSTTDAAAKAAKGAFKSFGKAMNAVAGTEDTGNHGPPVSVMAFKVLDLMKMHDDFHTKHGGRRGVAPAPAPRAQPRAKAPAPAPVHQQQARAAGLRQQQQRQQSAQQQQQQQRPPQQQQQQAQTGSLLDFGAEEAPPVQSSGRHLNHTTSSPASFNNLHSVPAPAPANETRAEKLKREYAKKHSNSKKVWDEVDQRWVEVDYKSFNSSFGAGNGAKKKEIGISLDSANAAGKSQSVQAAVNKRVNDMRQRFASEKKIRKDKKTRRMLHENNWNPKSKLGVKNTERRNSCGLCWELCISFCGLEPTGNQWDWVIYWRMAKSSEPFTRHREWFILIKRIICQPTSDFWPSEFLML